MNYLYFTTLAEAQERMYDYLAQRDNVSTKELKKMRQPEVLS